MKTKHGENNRSCSTDATAECTVVDWLLLRHSPGVLPAAAAAAAAAGYDADVDVIACYSCW